MAHGKRSMFRYCCHAIFAVAIESELFCADPRFNYSKRGAICSRDSGNILSFLSSTVEIFYFHSISYKILFSLFSFFNKLLWQLATTCCMRTIAALAAPVPAPEKALGHGARVAWYCSNKSNFNAWRFVVTVRFGPSACWWAAAERETQLSEPRV
jgi:hypothetical protein